jgi:polygalacturonase
MIRLDLQRTLLSAAICLASAHLSEGEIRQNKPLSNNYYNVIDYGAKADGRKKDTHPVQSAIDSCFVHGGGTIYFPSGIYLCGTLHLKSNVSLFLDQGSVLMMSTDDQDFDPYEKLDFKNAADKETSYFHYSLIQGEDIEHISILGEGTIDGNRSKRGGPKPIALKRCKYVTIKNITLKNAPNYNISMLGTDFVNISGVTILNGYSDGIDPDACRNIRISDCYIDCFDDAIVPKSSFSLGIHRPVENMTVTNCILATNCNAFKFGTESGGGFKNVTVSNCTVVERKTGKFADSGISLESVDGAEVESITISNISMKNVISPIFVRLGNRGRDLDKSVPGYIKNVIISNITVMNAFQASIISGIPGNPVESLTIANIKVIYAGGGSFSEKPENIPELESEYPDSDMFGNLPAYGFFCRHIRNLRLQWIDMTLENTDKRSAFVFDDVQKLDLESIDAQRSEGAATVIHFNEIKQVMIRGCSLPDDESIFFEAPANQRNEIRLVDNIQFR